MHKRLLIYICLLALIVGAFSVNAAAQAGQAEKAFLAGYALVDINPRWEIWTDAGGTIPYSYTRDQIMPLPMDGYGSSMSRLAEPNLSDDNGDGSVGAGDGLQATCIALVNRDTALLLISVDLLRTDDSWGKEVRQRISENTGVPVGNIMVSASHTHGGVDVDVSYSSILANTYKVTGTGDVYTGQQISDYSSAYIAYMKDQLVLAAESAMEHATAVTVRRGTIKANTQSGQNMGSVRHYQQWYNTKDASFSSGYRSTKYVRGSNFNGDMDFNGTNDPYEDYLAGTWRGEKYKSSTVSTTDDRLHLLEFVPQDGGQSIVLVNWRAHAHSGSKQANHCLTSDYVGAMRTSMAKTGYLAGFFQGAAGNLDNYNSARETTAWYRVGTTNYAQRSVNYGKTLSDVALALLNQEGIVDGALVMPMTEVETGEIRTKQLRYKFTGNKVTYVETAAATAHNAGNGCSRTDRKYPCAHTVQDQSGKDVTYVIASAYHASNVITRSKYSGNWSPNGSRGGAELNVLTIGDELLFVTAPFELFDRYSMDVTLATANRDNDWDDLAQLGYGTPFVFTCTNEYWGYIPNHLAYNYQEGYLHSGVFADGCYESQTSYVADGSGELLIDLYAQMVTELEHTDKQCPGCGAENPQWQPLTAQLLDKQAQQLPAGHYYLQEQLDYDKQITVVGGNLCLDLGGYRTALAVSGTWTVFDSRTDDFDVEDGVYGAIPAGSGAQAAVGYLAVTENGVTSYHKYALETTALVINPGKKGVAYQCDFKGDQAVRSCIREFGVAARADTAPDQASILADPECDTHVALTKDYWQTGKGENTLKSVYICNIILPSLTAAQNQERCKVPVYGRPYIQLEDGTMLLGNVIRTTMQGALEYADRWWDGLTEKEQRQLVAFYLDGANYQFMQNWNLPNIKAAAGK